MIKFGIIGMGERGRMFLETIRQNPFAEVAAVCDNNPVAVKAAETDYGVKCFTDFKEMMDSEKLSAVIVATPDFLHKDPVIYAAGKGLDMLVEKPFSTDEKECEEMLAAIEKNNVKCMVAFENRWNLPIAAVKAQIDAGRLGDILNINARLSNRIWVPTQYLSWSKGSSVAWFLFPHILDMTMWFNGYKKVKQVYCAGTKKKLVSMGYDLYDTYQAIVSFEDGTNATLCSTWVLPDSLALGYDLKMEVIGTESAVNINTHDQCVQHLKSDRIDNIHSLSQPINGRLTGCPSYMLHYFIDCLKDGVQPECDAKLGAYNTRIICAIHKSAEEGGTIIRF